MSAKHFLARASADFLSGSEEWLRVLQAIGTPVAADLGAGK
jgi:hypothetical protein